MVLDLSQIKRVSTWIGFLILVSLIISAVSAIAGDASPAVGKNSVDGPAPAAHTAQSAGDVMQGVEKPGTGDIHISADKLVSTRDDLTAEFSGNVLATQAGATIRSDRLRVHYERIADKKAAAGGEDKDPGGMGANRVRRIVAEGNVKIVMNNRTAFCDRAEYQVADGVIVLSGDDVRISQDENYIHGKQITLNRLTGAISVSGDPGKRVEAVFNPGTDNMPAGSRPQKTD